MGLDIGPATAGAVRLSSGAWTRSFARGWAAVNPMVQAVTLAPPKGAVDVTGKPVTTVRLGATSGVVLRIKR